MLAHGHPHCERYPIGKLFDEADIVVERENARIITEAKLIRSAIWSILSKEGGEAYSDSIDDINFVVKPRTII